MFRRLIGFLATILAACAQNAIAQTSAPAPDLARNPAPAAATLNPALPTLFVAGDSTAARGRGATQQGWGVPFADYFDPAKINVANRAVGGTGVRSFLDTGYWDLVTEKLKPGDVVLIQFGHNDNGARAPLKGIGGEVAERENPTTKEKGPMHTWGWYLRRYIHEARAKGATPVVCSLIPRQIPLRRICVRPRPRRSYTNNPQMRPPHLAPRFSTGRRCVPPAFLAATHMPDEPPHPPSRRAPGETLNSQLLTFNVYAQ